MDILFNPSAPASPDLGGTALGKSRATPVNFSNILANVDQTTSLKSTNPTTPYNTFNPNGPDNHQTPIAYSLQNRFDTIDSRFAPVTTTPALAPTQPTVSSPFESTHYSIKSGDTLHSIAKRFLQAHGIKPTNAQVAKAVAQITHSNGITHPDLIYAKQKIDLSSIKSSTASLQPSAQKGLIQPLSNQRVAHNPLPQATATKFPVFDKTLDVAVEKNYIHPDDKLAVQDQVLELAAQHGFNPDQLTHVSFTQASEGESSSTENALDELYFFDAPLMADNLSGPTLALNIPPTSTPTPQAIITAPAPTLVNNPEPVVAVESTKLSDVIYKGVVGKALDMIPMDPDNRVTLQQSNSIISGTTTGRMLAVLVKLSNPILTVAGLAWGIFSASKITPTAPASPAVVDATPPPKTKPLG